MSKSYRQIDFVSNGWGGGTNYNIPGPMGNQFASPYGDPYRVQGVDGAVGNFFSSAWNATKGLVTSIGKFAAPILPGLAPVAVGALPSKGSPQQAPAGSGGFAQGQADAQAQIAQREAEKHNTTIYLIAGGAALVTLYFVLSKKRRRK